MIAKKIISIGESKEFFDSSINTLEHAMGRVIVDVKKREISFDFGALVIMDENHLFADEIYDFDTEGTDKEFISFVENCISSEVNENTEYTFKKKNKDIMVKLEKVNDFIIHFYVIDLVKLVETEYELTKLNAVLETNNPIFTVCTWWIDYDKYSDHFFQTDSGPKALGIPVNKDRLYNTKEFSIVREKAARKTEFYDECIIAEKEMYEKIRNNETDYFGGRTPAYSNDDKEVWVESYGKCLLRYPDGRPRFFVAIDIYLSDLLESSNQISSLNNLIDVGLTNSNVGIWYYQKYHNEGRYYFTESHKKIMQLDEAATNQNITEKLEEHFAKILSHSPHLQDKFTDWRETHARIFTDGLDSYSKVIPNNINPQDPQWIEVRGTVMERDENGDVRLFIGVNVDITETIQKNIELERLRVENEHLHLAEKLAIKAGSVLVWYQDLNLIKDNDYIFGNETFSQQLGVERNKAGLLKLTSLRSTIVKSDRESRKMAKNFIRKLNELYTGKIDYIKNVLVKHFNYKTLEERYYEHTIEVESKFDDGSVKLVGGFMRDVTESVHKQEKITFLANNDMLTGVKNRNFFDNFINSGGLPDSYAVLLFDLDGLKLINDAFGHLEGDRMIKMSTDFIKTAFHNRLFIARIGGDEFIVLSEETDPVLLTDMANHLEALIEDYNKSSSFEINISKGGYVVVDNDEEFERAFTHAENLMYRRKLSNRSSRKSHALESVLETLNQKTEETKEHSERIAEISIEIMKELGMTRASEVEDMRLLAKLHDIGKITIPDNILDKPSRLTDEEYELIKKHSESGYKIVKNITDSDFVGEGVLSHHERFDGKGYPQGLSGKDIPLFARIMSVADSYDAMTSDRVYQEKKSNIEAIEEIKACSGTQFDPEIVEAFLRIEFIKKTN